MKLESRYRSLRNFSACVLVSSLLPSILLFAGCGRAHSDLYQQRMASEIRVLEDQLYDADYQNRVMQEKLGRYEQKVQAARIPTPNLDGQVIPEPNLPLDQGYSLDHGLETDAVLSMPVVDPNTSLPAGSILSDTSDYGPSFNSSSNVDALEIPRFDMGEVFDPNANASQPAVPSSPQAELPQPVRPAELGEPTTKTDPKGLRKKSSGSADKRSPKPLRDPPKPIDELPELPRRTDPPARKPKVELLPPPSTPVPPGKEEVRPDAIIPGLPSPPTGRGDPESPPGQIPLPENVQSPLRAPERIELHPSRSLGHHDGTLLDGATLVVNAVDAMGKRVDFNKFNVDAELSIVILDPERSPSEARLGRWDFDAAQVTAMISGDQGTGIEVPIRFENAKPITDKVIVHVRLRGEDDEMRCNDHLDLRERTAKSAWTPRGTKTTR